jgi:hypothetical protein
MPSYKYSEISYGKKIENIANGDGLWSGYLRMHSWITWDNVRTVARRYLTEKQYYVFVRRGKNGLLYREFEDDIGITIQSSQERLDLAVRKLKKVFQKYLKSRVYMRGGFLFHVEMERKLKLGEYFERFK